MQRYNEPPPRTPRSQTRRYEPSSPTYGPDEVAPPSPRRGDLRQPTINSFTPFSRVEDEAQLDNLYGSIRDLIQGNVTFEDAEAEVNSLQGHQDIKDMFAGVGNMEFIPGTRRLLDILELTNNKIDAIEAQANLEAANAENADGEIFLNDLAGGGATVVDDIANADTEVDTDADTDDEADTDSDDEGVVRRLRFDF